MDIDIFKSSLFFIASVGTVVFAILAIFFNAFKSIIFSLISFIFTAIIFCMLGVWINVGIHVLFFCVLIPLLFLGFAKKVNLNLGNCGITSSARLYFSIFFLGVLFLSLVYLIATSLNLNSNIAWVALKEQVLENEIIRSSIFQSVFVDNFVAFLLFVILVLITIVGISTFDVNNGGRNEQ
ncbi:MAG: hypothetical protein MJ229_01190 [bacterium]|nr:hypothetical protein [bacterium]